MFDYISPNDCITRCRNLLTEFQKTHRVTVTAQKSEIAPGLGSRVNAQVSTKYYHQSTELIIPGNKPAPK